MATNIYLCGYNPSTGLVAGTWIYPEGSEITPVSQGLAGAYEDVTALSPYPSPGWTRTGPLAYTPVAFAAAPDLDGFATSLAAAVVAGNLSIAGGQLCATYHAWLTAAISADNTPAIEALWAIIKPTLSTAEVNVIVAAAAASAIPGIT